MKLQFEDLKKKRFTVVPETNINEFGEKVSDFAVDKLLDTVGEDYDIKDIQMFLISNIIELSKSIKDFKDLCFICEPEDGGFLWNVTVDKDIVTLDAYEVNMQSEGIHCYFSCELYVKDDSTCQLNIDFSIPEGENEDSLNLDMIKLSKLSRLMFYITLISKENK